MKTTKKPVLTAKDRADFRAELLPLTREISKLTRAVNELRKEVRKDRATKNFTFDDVARWGREFEAHAQRTGTMPDQIVKDKPMG